MRVGPSVREQYHRSTIVGEVAISRDDNLKKPSIMSVEEMENDGLRPCSR